MKVHEYQIRPNIPEALRPLNELACNVWYSWNWDAVELFIRLDAAVWERCYQNPVLMLGVIPSETLDAAAKDESYVAALNRVYERYRAYMAARGWYDEKHADQKDLLVAYFSCEYGLDEGLPIYSGGLGVLSGDHLKSSSDLGIPLVGVGLLYQKGYFRQVLSLDGWQKETYPDNDWYNMPVCQETGADGKPLSIEVDLAGERVVARIWRVQVGRTPLYLLDTNVPENSPKMREVTSTLYGGDREMRIRQEIVLGVGGVRALKALGLDPTVFHMNEGHSAFLALERIRSYMVEKGVSYATAMEQVFATNVFTTHTPVPAGNEIFGHDLVRRYMAPIMAEIGLQWRDFVGLGQAVPGESPDFGMTVLALRTAAHANGVSELHAEVSRSMWKDLWPSLPVEEVPIRAITNGIHTRSWISHDLGDLFLRYIGPRFIEKPGDPSIWDHVDRIPSSELWRTHERRKERLVFFVRKRMVASLKRQGAGSTAIRAAEEVLDPDVLTIGFSRRFATYKRAGLLFQDPERLARLLTNADRPVQILFAGKAHPQDMPAKEIIKAVIHATQDARIRHHLVFLEDYDINVARYLVQGVDVWMNNPRRPMEASGTSGMKAAANGALNLSILDGWWCEGYANAPDSGWAIGSGETYADPAEQDRIEGQALYNILEQEVVPLYYDRDKGGMPRRWIDMMRASIQKLGAFFNTHRMLTEYLDHAYLPAHRAGSRLASGNLEGARNLGEWRARVAGEWEGVTVRVENQEAAQTVVGDSMELTLRAQLGTLSPDEVSVEVMHGPLDSTGEIRNGRIVVATLVGEEHGEHVYRAGIPAVVTGMHGYAARVMPQHPDLASRFIPDLITWEA